MNYTTETLHIVELQTRTERGPWERAQTAATLAGKYIGVTYSAQKA